MSEPTASLTVVAQLVETMRALAGSHPGFRPVHAKGIVCAGTFRGAPDTHGASERISRLLSTPPNRQPEPIPISKEA
jgi:hypothetical protein